MATTQTYSVILQAGLDEDAFLASAIIVEADCIEMAAGQALSCFSGDEVSLFPVDLDTFSSADDFPGYSVFEIHSTVSQYDDGLVFAREL